MENVARGKDEAYENLEKNYKSLQEDREAMSTLLQLSQAQFDTSLQENKVLEAITLYAGSSHSGSSSREQELEQQLALQKTLVDAQCLESYSMFNELQQAKAKLATLKEASLM